MPEAQPKSTSILNLVNRTLDLPTMPEVLVRLNEVIGSDDSTAADVADVIAKDPAISANLLRIVNSAYYGLQVRVSSIGLAVSILGFNMTKKVALKAAVFSRFAKKGKAPAANPCFDPADFWRHSIFCGVAARIIGKQSSELRSHHPEDLYICGLLHDIGTIILFENAPEELAAMVANCARTGRSQVEAEQDAFGFTHADVGSVLAIKWFLPEDLTIAIRYHHQPVDDPFHRSLSSLIHLADHLAWSAGRPSLRELRPVELQHEVYDAIGIEPRAVEKLLPTVEAEFTETGLPF